MENTLLEPTLQVSVLGVVAVLVLQWKREDKQQGAQFHLFIRWQRGQRFISNMSHLGHSLMPRPEPRTCRQTYHIRKRR